MSAFTNIRPNHSTAHSLSYQELGATGTTKRAQHIAAGTSRAIRSMNDLGTDAAFASYCQAITDSTARHIGSFSTITSFDPQHFNADKREDIDAAFAITITAHRRQFPHSPISIKMHTDGKSGTIHSHGEVANHNIATGTALQGYAGSDVNRTRVDALRRTTDRVLIERGYAASKLRGKALDWDKARQKMLADSNANPEHIRVGDAIDNALMDPQCTSIENFNKLLASDGITAKISVHHSKNLGTTYGMTYHYTADAADAKVKNKRHQVKASKLSTDFQYESVRAICDASVGTAGGGNTTARNGAPHAVPARAQTATDGGTGAAGTGTSDSATGSRATNTSATSAADRLRNATAARKATGTNSTARKTRD